MSDQHHDENPLGLPPVPPVGGPGDIGKETDGGVSGRHVDIPPDARAVPGGSSLNLPEAPPPAKPYPN